MHHKTGKDRRQTVLIPTCLDDIIPEDNPVRLVDVFADATDLDSHGFAHVQPKENSAPPYEPSVLLKIYLYGYLNYIRSSPKLPLPSRLRRRRMSRNLNYSRGYSKLFCTASGVTAASGNTAKILLLIENG